MLLEMDNDLEELQLKLETATVASKTAQLQLRKAQLSLDKARAARDDAFSEEEIDSKEDALLKLQKELETVRQGHRGTLMPDADVETTERAGSEDRCAAIDSHIQDALSLIENEITSLEDKKLARQKLFANLKVLVKNADAQLEVKRQEAQRAKEELNEHQADYDEARAERDLFDPSADLEGTRTRRSGWL